MAEEKFSETVAKVIKALEKIRTSESNRNKSSMIGKVTLEVYNEKIITKGNSFTEDVTQE